MATTKNEAIKQILGIMVANEVTVQDIDKALKAQQRPKVEENYDLLCESNGKLTRVSFEQGQHQNPIAIFLHNASNLYLMLDETGMVPFPPLEEKQYLPDDTLCNLLMEGRTELNEKLRELGKPILSGEYWLNGHEHADHIGYWMATIRQDQLKVDYDNANRRAKVRKIGRL